MSSRLTRLLSALPILGLAFLFSAPMWSARHSRAEEPAGEPATADASAEEAPAEGETDDAPPYRMPAFMMITTVEWPEDPELQDQLCQFMLAHGFNCVETELAGLEACRRNGIYARLGGDLEELHRAAADLRDDPNVFCYFISDRRRADSFPAFAQNTQAFREADPTHPSMIINYACFNEYRQFAEQVDPPLLDYYHYHWDRRRHPERRYLYLDEFRKLAQERDIPLVRCVDAGVSTEQVRQTIFTSLAYGVKGFHYWVPWIIGWEKDEAGNPVVVDGQLSCRVNVPAVGTVAEEVQYIGPALVNAESTAVYFTAPLYPDWASCQPIPEDFWAELAGEQLLLGVLEDVPNAEGSTEGSAEESGYRYLLVVNCDAGAERPATLTLHESPETLERMEQATGEWVAVDGAGQQAIELTLPAGGGTLFRLK